MGSLGPSDGKTDGDGLGDGLGLGDGDGDGDASCTGSARRGAASAKRPTTRTASVRGRRREDALDIGDMTSVHFVSSAFFTRAVKTSK
jgi:hypothetical protein